jgi:integrase/recombinase XerD
VAEEVSRGHPRPPGDLARLLAEHESWLAVERGVAANTLAAYRRDLRAYTRFLQARGIDEPLLSGGTANPGLPVGPETVAAFVEYLKAAKDEEGRARFAPASVARMLVAVRSFHRFCLTEGHAGSDPSEDVTAPRVPQGIPKALTEEEVDTLLAAVAGDDSVPAPVRLRDRALLETLYATGMRISELVGLDLGALDLDGGYLRAFGKGAKERVVPVGRAAADAIEAWLPARAEFLGRARRRDPEAVFVNRRGGRITRQGCWKIVRRYGQRAGLGSRLSPHVLRHSCATHMVDRGADLLVVQELLGHASVSTTQVYTKVTQSRLRAVYDAAHPRARAPATSPNPGRGA